MVKNKQGKTIKNYKLGELRKLLRDKDIEFYDRDGRSYLGYKSYLWKLCLLNKLG